MNIKLLAKRMLLGFSTAAVTASGFFAIHETNSEYTQAKISTSTVSPHADTEFVPRADNVAPDELYMMATLQNPFVSSPGNNEEAMIEPILSYIAGLQNQGMLTTDMEELYLSKYGTINAWTSWPSFIPMPSATEAAAQQAFQQVSSVGWTTDSYNIINQFSAVDKAKVLELKSPSEVNDVYSNSAVTMPLDFAYKVVEINVDDVPLDEETNEDDIIFTYKNDANIDGDEYNIVLSNSDGGLNAIASQTDLDEYMQEYGIYIRDDNNNNPFDINAGSYPSVAQLHSQLNFVFNEDATTGAKTISIWVETGSNNIEFGVNPFTSDAAAGAFTFGFLESSVSPIHVDQIMSDVESTPSTPNINTNPIAGAHEDISVQERYTDWATITSIPEISEGEHIRFFMAPYTVWEAEIFYKGNGSDVFQSQENILTLEHTGQAIDQSPSSFQINTEDFDGGADPIYISTTQYDINGKNWMQVDIVMDKGDVQLSPKVGDPQDPYSIFHLSSQIFYNIDGAFNSSWTSTGGFIELIQETNQDEKYKEILGDIYTNWSRAPGYDAEDDENLIKEDIINFPGGNGIPPGYDYFQNSFDSYYIEDSGAIVPNLTTSSNGMDLPIIDITNGKFERDENGDLVYQLTTGYNIVDTLTTTANLLATWSVTKLGADPDTVREHDFYRIVDGSKSISFVQNNIINNSGISGDTLVKTAEALTRFWSGDLPTQEQTAIVNDLKTQYPQYDLDNLVKDVGFPGNHDADSDMWQNSRQYIFHILQPLMAAALQELFILEIRTFENLMGSILGVHMSSYLETSDSEDIGINIDALQLLDNSDYPEEIAGLQLTALSGAKTVSVSNGAESLGSLVEFLGMFLVDGKYLGTETEQAQFRAFVEAGAFTDAEIYKDPNRQDDIKSMIGLLDEIIANGDFKTEETKTLTEIVEDIISLKNTDPMADIRAAIQSVTHAIASNTDAVMHEFFGQQYGTTIMDNLVIGRNIRVIITEYKDRLVADDEWDKLTDAERAAVDNGISGSYDPKTITQLGINLGYYNLSSFFTRLSEAPFIPGTALEILGSDLLNNLLFEVPAGNAFVDLISDSSVIYGYASMFAGVVLFIISLSTLGMTLRRSAKEQQSIKSLLVFRLAFVAVGLAGLGIGASGLLIGAL